MCLRVDRLCVSILVFVLLLVTKFIMLFSAVSDTTLPTLDSRTNVEEDPSLTPTIVTASVTAKKVKVVKF